MASAVEDLKEGGKILTYLESVVLANGRIRKSVFDGFEEIEMEMEKVLGEKDKVFNDCLEFLKSKEQFEMNQEKIVKGFRNRIQKVQTEYSMCLEERESLKLENLELSKKQFDTEKELKSIRKKIRQNTISGSLDIEKYCVKCQKSFVDSENFNWSCKSHMSLIHNNIFWCCGKEGKEAPGCIISRHLSKLDSEPPDATSNIKFCAGCKDSGHSISNCPRDPNIKTLAESSEDLKRVEKLNLSKRRMSVIELSTLSEKRILSGIEEKMIGSDFIKEFDSDEELDELNGVFFGDVLEIKEELGVESGFKWLEGLYDIEKEEKSRKKRTSVVLHTSSYYKN